jgi:K+-sensing histidine kinase KdpD
MAKPRASVDDVAAHLERERADTEREQLLLAAQRHVALLHGLSEASLAINSAVSLDAVLQTITEKARELVGAHQSVTSMTTGSSWAQAINSVSLSDKYAQYRAYAAKTDGSGIYSVVCRLNATLRMTQPELEAHPAWRSFGGEASRHPPMRGWLAAPLVSRSGENIGLIQLSDKYEGDFTDEDEAILVQLAQLAAVAIENARFQHATEQARQVAEQEARRTSQLQQVTAALGGTLSAQDVADVAISSVMDVLGASATVVYLLGADGELELAAHRGLCASIERWRRLPWETPLPLVTAIRTGEPVWLTSYEDLVTAYPAVTQSSCGESQLRAVAALPLTLHGTALGGIALSFAQERAFTPPECEMLVTLAHQCAQAVERANLLAAERAARAERERFVAELQQTVYYNEIFAGILAHDLRNPLTAILTSAHLILRRQEGEGDKLAKPLGRILTSGERMTRMIDQLLDFTSLRIGGGLQIVPRGTDLGEVCRQVVEELEDANPTWTIRTEASGDLLGNWDGDRLLQVVSNLAANALQHGDPEAGLLLHIDGTSDVVELRVSNKGSIPESALPTLFDPFRGARQRSDRPRGLGLGLYITKQIVHAHGGSVSVESSEETGTTFIVRLPR